MADILSDAIFQVIEQRGTSLLIDKALKYLQVFLCVFVGVKAEFGLVLRGKFDTLLLFFANYLTIMARSMISLLLSTVQCMYLL